MSFYSAVKVFNEKIELSNPFSDKTYTKNKRKDGVQ